MGLVKSAEKLQNEYEKLVAGLQEANEHREDEDMLANPGGFQQ
jgi:DNA excision repair protein ERCC-2